MNKYTKTHHDWKYMTKEEFIEKTISVWGDIYSYEHTKIYRATTPVIITCKKHGNFEQIISNHLRGHNGCVACRCEKSETDYNSLMKKFKELHGDKYDYSLIAEKIPMSKIIDIICPVHGVFKQDYCNHKTGNGCPKCCKTIKDNRESFIEKANKKHNNKYNYDLVDYINSKTKVKIICQDHGIFEMAPDKHLMGQGCRGCSNMVIISKDVFIKKATEKHNNKYDYSRVVFDNPNEKIEIICPKHGVFEQNVRYHMYGNGCPTCSNHIPYTIDRFILSANHIHENKYDYSKTEFKSIIDKVVIICPIHGEFKQRGCKHISGKQGCPHCQNVTNESRGSKKIKKYLQSINIPFVPEFRFDDCKNKNKLPFDFKITIDHKLALIEFNGEQHFKESGWQPLEYIQTNDKIKRDYCKSKNIHLLDINYNEEHLIPEKINTFISMLKGDK